MKAKETEIYKRLGRHLEQLVMGYPYTDELMDLLTQTFSPDEARVALAIPNTLLPLEVADLDTIVNRSGLSKEIVAKTLQSLSSRNLLYTGRTASGATGYAILQIGYGMPQTFLWGGKQDDRARQMSRLILNYFSTPTTQTVYGGVPTKTYKYSPANVALDVSLQGCLPHEQMEPIVQSASQIAVAHCPCRMSARILGRTDCQHSLEVCIKYDDMAEFVISKGLARKISKDEALHILGACEKEGLVHMVDNAQGDIKHTCNCCGHYCWNVGTLRRRKIPRDVLMAVYFIRETDVEACIGCGACAEICPVASVMLKDDIAQIDIDWCIGCGVCAGVCPTDAISIARRTECQSPESFTDLHQRIKKERQLIQQ